MDDQRLPRLSLRDLLAASAVSAAGQAARKAGAAEPATPPILTEEDLERALPSLSNWGRWGREDQLGTLNFITAQRRAGRMRSISPSMAAWEMR